jgi:hypothetical protein
MKVTSTIPQNEYIELGDVVKSTVCDSHYMVVILCEDKYYYALLCLEDGEIMPHRSRSVAEIIDVFFDGSGYIRVKEVKLEREE